MTSFSVWDFVVRVFSVDFPTPLARLKRSVEIMSAVEAVMKFSKVDRESPISLDEWSAAVSKIEGLRMEPENTVVENPQTGETISIKGPPGDTAVYFPDDDDWYKVFNHHDDTGWFEYPLLPPFGKPADCPVRSAAKSLADELGAIVLDYYGDEWDYA